MSTIAPAATTTSALARAFRLAPALGRGLLTIVLAVVGTASQVVVPILIQQMTDNEILGEGGVDIEGALTLGGLALLAIAVGVAAQRAALARLATSSAMGLADLRVGTFRHLHQLSMLHVQSQRRGASWRG